MTTRRTTLHFLHDCCRLVCDDGTAFRTPLYHHARSGSLQPFRNDFEQMQHDTNLLIQVGAVSGECCRCRTVVQRLGSCLFLIGTTSTIILEIRWAESQVLGVVCGSVTVETQGVRPYCRPSASESKHRAKDGGPRKRHGAR